MLQPEEVARVLEPTVVRLPKTLAEKIAFRERHLTDYQNARRAARYRALVDRFTDEPLREAVALGYHKLLTYKDEYEVARLLADTQKKAEASFDGDLKLSYHLAPPMISGEGPDGRPKKRKFGQWIGRAFPWLAKGKVLRETPFDPFGYTAERKMERALIAEYERDMEEVLTHLRPDTMEAAVALAKLPLDIRGFGPVKDAGARAAAKRREEYLAALRAAPRQVAAE